MSAPAQTENVPRVRGKRTAEDFIFGKLLGEGSFSAVYLAKDVRTSKEYAVKVCQKEQMIRERKLDYITREREALNRLSGQPGFLNFYCTFQDMERLFYVMTYARGGTLLQLMEKLKNFDIECVRFYSAQILLAVEQMHAHSIIHRDLKPENILLDEKFNVMIGDFGSSRFEDRKKDFIDSDAIGDNSASESNERSTSRHRKRGSFVGTAQYVSPEILKGRDSSSASDLWSFGCIMYQMVAGFPPFQGPNDYIIFQKITKLDLTFPNDFDPVAADLIGKLIVLSPQKRLGVQDHTPYDSIRNHQFMEGIDFSTIRRQRPPFLKAHSCGEGTKEDLTMDTFLFPDNLKPGLDNAQLTRLIGQDWLEIGASAEETSNSTEPKKFFSDKEKQILLEKQKADIWDPFAEGEVILKKGIVNKRKGMLYVQRRRMLLLTTGPKLIYIDPVQMVKKGEISWSKDLRVEAKNFKLFFVHTPDRIYYLEDPEGYALKWCEAIEDAYNEVYKK